MPVADALTTIMRLADRLANDQPRNLDVATLRYAVRQLVTATAPPAAVPIRKRGRRVVAPGYWALRKRVQRARAKAVAAAARIAGPSG
jgi:hypothetical protein